jgi:hypothetical protein
MPPQLGKAAEERTIDEIVAPAVRRRETVELRVD